MNDEALLRRAYGGDRIGIIHCHKEEGGRIGRAANSVGGVTTGTVCAQWEGDWSGSTWWTCFCAHH
jgi:hypothetical protein